MKFYIVLNNEVIEKNMNHDGLIQELYECLSDTNQKLYFRNTFLDTCNPIKYYFPFPITDVCVYSQPTFLYTIKKVNKTPLIIVGIYLTCLVLCNLLLQQIDL